MIYNDSIAEVYHHGTRNRMVRFFKAGNRMIQQLVDVSVPQNPLALTWTRIPAAKARRMIKEHKAYLQYTVVESS